MLLSDFAIESRLGRSKFQDYVERPAEEGKGNQGRSDPTGIVRTARRYEIEVRILSLRLHVSQ